MKLMGIDYGRRRIGIAVSDDEGTLARSIGIVDRKSHPNYIDELTKIISQENPAAIVFGLPLSIDDEETAMSREVREFATAIEQRVNLPIHFIDESFTSKKAAELMMYRKKKARRDKSLSDRIASCLILQEYIEHCLN
ncbi:MAG: Holliday junction resolvase RuvX [Chitinispirillales bacterium]|jgi:putative Holliday junction resolvase|nr:Holliday junction resolvase RuvX [Chitinispirillales bacterium]